MNFHKVFSCDEVELFTSEVIVRLGFRFKRNTAVPYVVGKFSKSPTDLHLLDKWFLENGCEYGEKIFVELTKVNEECH